MGKTLIIAEKPSVMADLAKALGKLPGMTKFENHKDYLENETHVISSAVGHLLELTMPTREDGKKLQWKFEHLPVLPAQFDLQPAEKGEARLKMLKKLLSRKDVDDVVNACDAGREGELIFRYIAQYVGLKKPIKRLWMQSMTVQSIQKAFSQLRTDAEMRPLADAATCRSESDWLVGINGTRAMTAYNSRNGGFLKTTVGRVQTPTLTILVERELEIANFVPRAYWEVVADFGVAAGNYKGKWIDEAFKKEEKEGDTHARQDRLWDKSLAEAVVARCQGKPGKVSEAKKPAKQAPPLLYDLTSLQREGNSRFGFSARRTLQIAQSLYEGHKVLTYPRTDSRYLPEDYIGTVKGVMTDFGKLGGASVGDFPADLPKFADRAVQQNMIFPSKRIFDNSKVSDHFAIIPTGQVPKNLKPEEQKLYDMVTRRFIAVFYPSAEFEVTTRLTRIEQDCFKTEGKVMRVPGWLEVYGKLASENDDSIVPVKEGEPAKNLGLTINDFMTKPQPHFNESTLLSAMEGAGKRVDDEDLADAMSERGLGTPATRASIIEGLIYEAYIVRDQNHRDLIATTKGISLIQQLQTIGIEALTSPQMTGEWEYKLKQMEQGKLDRTTFMKEIRHYSTLVVDKAKAHMNHVKNADYPDLPAMCPQCQTKPLRTTDNAFKCKNPECGWSTYKTLAGRMLEPEEAVTLLNTGFVGPLTGFRNRFGKDFDAALKLTPERKVDFVFEGGDGQSSPEEDLQILEDPANIVCPCPVCASKGKTSNIYQTDTHYVCEAVVRGDKSCKPKGRLARELCQYQISKEQAIKFFQHGSTDIIDKFISKKNKPFKAALKLAVGGKVVFEWDFPPREARPKAAKKTAK
jgi:DNA topoisomerase III